MSSALYIIQQHDYSGAEIMHLPLFLADPDALVACPPDSRTAEWLESHGVATAPLSFRTLRHSGGPVETVRSLGRGLASALELRRLLRAHPERGLIYCISLRPGMLAALAGIGLGRRKVWYVTDFTPPQPLGALTRGLALMGCDVPVATSDAVRHQFVGRHGRLRRRCITITPGVDPERFDPSAAEPGLPRAAVLGHVSPTKRTDLALDVATVVARHHPEFRLDILGRAQFRQEDFDFERSLQERVARQSELSDHVTFNGYATDVPAALANCGLLLHCRPDEPFGVAVIEAMAAGIPVVVPAAAGPAEIVENGVTGLVYPPGDAEAAARQVLRLLAEPELARELGAAGRRAAVQRFHETRQAERLAAVVAEQTPAS